MAAVLETLRAQLMRLEGGEAPRSGGRRFALGEEAVDRFVGGGLKRGVVHEILPQGPGDAGAVSGFVAGLSLRAMRQGQSVLWIRQTMSEAEYGALYGPGLLHYGLDPARLILLRLKKAEDVLRAGLEGAGCAALGAVVIEIWGNPKSLDLTASRRLALSAGQSHLPVFLVRLSGTEEPGAVETRWAVRAMPSRPLLANAPGLSGFEIQLLRHRAGPAGGPWQLEWNSEQHIFSAPAPLSRPVVSVSERRPPPAPNQAQPTQRLIPFSRTG